MKSQAIGAMIAAVLAACSLPAFAQDYTSYGGPSAFEGVYAGAYAGGVFDPTASAALGGLVGANFEVTDSMYIGAEVQGGVITNSLATTYDALMLAKGGVLVAPDTMVYGALGGGWVGGAGSWAVGGGAELMATDSIGVRGELLGTGDWGSGWSATKATAGVVLHMK